MGDHLHRVVITGLGAVSPLGLTMEASWDGLLAGRSAVRSVTKVNADDFNCKVAAEIRDFDPVDFMDGKEARRSDPFVHYAVAAAKMARADGALEPSTYDPYRLGVIIGSGIGGMQTIERQSAILHSTGPRRISPFMIPSLIVDMASGVVAIEVGAKGPNFAAVSACASGSHSIGEAFHFLRFGKADVMLAGGTESAINPFGFAGFCAMRTMSTGFNDRPQEASRPFDGKRDGFVMGEGAAVLLLETLDHAERRGATILCELVAYSASCDAFHITAPDLDGKTLATCLSAALNEAGLDPSEVDYINAHGTSTAYNDRCETNAYKRCFGDRARAIAISSTKSMTGHMLGAAGSFESAVCVKAIETGKVPPTINYEIPDPDCDLNYTPNRMVERPIRVAINDSLGFGGHNAVLIFKRFEG